MYTDNKQDPGSDTFSSELLLDLIGFLKIIAEETRFKILRELFSAEECTVSELYKALQISQSSASQHLRVLKNSGILKYRREGRKTFYSVDREGIITRYGDMIRYLHAELFSL